MAIPTFILKFRHMQFYSPLLGCNEFIRLRYDKTPITYRVPTLVLRRPWDYCTMDYSDFIMRAMASQNSLLIVCSTVCSRSKKISKFGVTGFREGNPSVNGGFPHKVPVTRTMFLFDDVIIGLRTNEPIRKPLACARASKLTTNIYNGITIYSYLYSKG